MGASPLIDQPCLWLGAASPGGLSLPDASATDHTMYGPRGVFANDRHLIVADSGNHRVLLWHGWPQTHHAPAHVVLGQADFTCEGPQAGGRGPCNGMHLPTAVLIAEDRLFVADAWHHRVLVWNRVPTTSDQPPDYAVGQDDLSSVAPNRGRPSPALDTLYWPYGLAWIDGRFFVADTGNRRVLVWDHGIPLPGEPATRVLGQSTPADNRENRGGRPNGCSFRWPHALAGSTHVLYVADAGNHRVLGWSPPPGDDRPADLVLGQINAESAVEFPYQPQGPRRLRFPYGIALDDRRLAVADTSNNRILLWTTPPQRGVFLPAQRVLGQSDFDSSGENRWQAVANDTFCWPYAVALHNNRLWVADSGNNRVMAWSLAEPASDQPLDKADRNPQRPAISQRVIPVGRLHAASVAPNVRVRSNTPASPQREA